MNPRSLASRMRTGAVLLLVFPLIGACGQAGLYGAPLPGGAELGDHPYRVVAQFGDVLDLVPQASVRLNDVPIGKVDEVTLAPDGSVALVTLLINGGVKLPADSRAELRSASLLGEKFVELEAPRDAKATGQLRDGAVIPLSGTRRYPEVEEVFGALSLLLNGGGLGQLQDVIREVNATTTGNEPQLRDLLSQVGRLTGQLNAQRDTIVRAIDGLDRLSATLTGQTDNINTALDELGPGLAVLEEQRGQLVDMLKSLDTLSGVTVDTVHRSRDDLLADLRALRPTLRQLAKSGSDIPNSLQILLTFPYPDYAMKSLKGDFFNADVKVDLDLSSTLGNLLRAQQPIIPIPGTPAQPLPDVLGNLLPTSPKAQSDKPETPPAGIPGLLSPLTGGR